jgi:hypothetical protein
MPIIVRPEDVARVIGAAAPETSNARRYFTSVKNRNSTQIAVADIRKTVGNVPVIARGGIGVRPDHGANVEFITPMAVEIDDVITAVQMDEYERATGLGRQQIIDELLSAWFEIIRRTTRALCAQAHKGSIDYMMQAGQKMGRYEVEYGTVTRLEDETAVSSLTASKFNEAFEALIEVINNNGIGGEVEYVAEAGVFGKLFELAINQTRLPVATGTGYIDVGGYRVWRDNDAYTDIAVDGTSSVKRMLDTGELLARAKNAGQELNFLRVDDTVLREAMPMYSFTKERQDQRGTDLYVKSKPFPLVNVKGIAIMKFGA